MFHNYERIKLFSRLIEPMKLILYLEEVCTNKTKAFRIALLLFYVQNVCYKHTFDVLGVVAAEQYHNVLGCLDGSFILYREKSSICGDIF